MSQIDVYDINKVRSSLIRVKFSNELGYLQDNIDQEQDSDQEENWMSERIVKLNKIIEIIDQHAKITNKCSSKIEHDEINKYVFQKSWLRLPPYHKSVKLTEYLTTKLTDEISEKELKKLITMGTDLINSNQLTNKLVTYDSNKGQITDVPALIYTKKKDKWSFALTQTEINSNANTKTSDKNKDKTKTKSKNTK